MADPAPGYQETLNLKNMMKKYLIIAVAAVATMAACSKVETIDNTPNKAINFTVVNHLQQTKATAGLTYPTTVPFGTFAWWTENDWTGIAADLTFVFMDNQEVTWHSIETNTPEVWAPTETYYWTKSGKITFASYSPYTEDGTDKGYSEVPEYDVTKGFLFDNYTIVSTTDVDLMYANLAANCTQKTNVDGSSVTDDSNPEGGYSGVPTIFNHALCQLGFEFRAIGKKNPNVNAIKIEITDVDIVNIDNKGSFTQIPANNGTVKWATDHANYKANYDYAPASQFVLDLIENTAANVAATDNYTAIGKTRILLPQALLVTLDTNNEPEAIATTTDQKLVIAYTIKTEYKSAIGTWAEEEVVSSVRLNNGNIAAWADNQNITYRISINPYANVPVTFDPAIVDWDDVYSDDIEIVVED